jgi:hypothetical protein
MPFQEPSRFCVRRHQIMLMRMFPRSCTHLPRTRRWIPLLSSGTDRPHTQSTTRANAMTWCPLSFIYTRRRSDITASVLWRDIMQQCNAFCILKHCIPHTSRLQWRNVMSDAGLHVFHDGSEMRNSCCFISKNRNSSRWAILGTG